MDDWQQTVDLVCRAPAKINLFLHVLARRSDGYHNLQTAFQFLDFYDTLGFRLRQDGAIVLQSALPQVALQQNLIYRAAQRLQQVTMTRLGVDIWLDKRIPMGGGLGGGSSNAATTLLALNVLWNTGLDKTQLLALALPLGADVPVFVFAQSAWAEGVGEQLTAITPPTPWYLVLIPPCIVPTHEIFNDRELTRDTPASRMFTLLACDVVTGRYTFFGANDCERVVRKRYPQVDAAFAWLSAYAQPRLSGTGACVFAAFASRERAEQVLAQVQPGFTGFVASGINRSPWAKFNEATICNE